MKAPIRRSHSGEGRRFRSKWLLLPLTLGMLLILSSIAAPVDAIGKQSSVLLSGNAVPSACNGDVGLGAIELSGDMEGCLTFLDFDFECKELNGFALYNERGRESFAGTANGVEGTFTTRYTLEATYKSGACEEFNAGGFPFEQQMTGGCDHFIVNGTGAFRDARGLVTFFDVIPDPGESGASNFFYTAQIRRLRA